MRAGRARLFLFLPAKGLYMRILMLGSKEHPFGVSAGHDPKAGGGIELHVEKLSKYLARRGHRVFIITRRFPGQASREDVEGVCVIRTRHIRNRYLRGFSCNLLGFIRAVSLVRKERIDLIHSHAVTAGFFGSMLSRITGKPMVFTPHGMIVDWRFPVREILRGFQKAALREASRTIFISKPARDALSGFAKKGHALLSNAIDLEDYDFRAGRSGEVRFLFLGRLEKVKGVDTLIEAFKIMLGRYPRARLMIAGEGSMKARVVDMVIKAGSDRIRYMGWMDSRKALKESDVFVLPSTEKGQPVALLEAMAAGKVIITSLPFIKPGKTGVECRAGDPEGLARVMLKVCREFSSCRKLGLEARESVRSLTWESLAESFEKEYQKVIS
jgi:glycosyltransferase involved in cell wall biosynthesis